MSYVLAVDLGTTFTAASILRDGAYGVSVLRAGHEGWSRHFGGQPQPAAAPLWRTVGRVPVLVDALAWFACTVDSVVVVGDHTLFVARVADCEAVDGAPLVAFASGYRSLPAAPSRSAI